MLESRFSLVTNSAIGSGKAFQGYLSVTVYYSLNITFCLFVYIYCNGQISAAVTSIIPFTSMNYNSEEQLKISLISYY